MAHQPVGRADRPTHEFAAAVRTAPAEHALGAIAAEGALVGADPRLRRVRRQILVAAFTAGPQFEHRPSLRKSERRHRAGDGCYWRAAFVMTARPFPQKDSA